MKQVVERLVTFEHWVLVVAGGSIMVLRVGCFLFLFSLGYIDNSKFRNYE